MIVMYYVVGLGNPGNKYKDTRHNIGWKVLDEFADNNNFSEPETVGHLSASVRKGTIREEAVWLVYPQTYMNKTGQCVQAILKDEPEAKIIIVQDDSAIPVGSLRIVEKRGDGGHNGIKSIFNQTKRKDFVRLRVGIAPVSWWSGERKIITGNKQASFVLKPFSFLEMTNVQKTIKQAVGALETIIKKNSVEAMNEFNK